MLCRLISQIFGSVDRLVLYGRARIGRLPCVQADLHCAQANLANCQADLARGAVADDAHRPPSAAAG